MTAAFGESPALSTLITVKVTENNAGQSFTCCWRQKNFAQLSRKSHFSRQSSVSDGGTDGRKLRPITITLIACLYRFIKFSIGLTTWHYELINLYHHSITQRVASVLYTRSSIKRNARQLKLQFTWNVNKVCSKIFLRAIRFSCNINIFSLWKIGFSWENQIF